MELKLISGSIDLLRNKNNACFSFGFTGTKIPLLGGTFTSDLNIQMNGEFNTGAVNTIMNGGSISFRSKPEKGTTVELTFPLQEESAIVA